MSDRVPYAGSSGGMVLTPTAGNPYNADPGLKLDIGAANIAAAASIAGGDYVLAFIGGVPKLVTKTDLLATVGLPFYLAFSTKWGAMLDAVASTGNKATHQRKFTGVAGRTNTVVGIQIQGADALNGVAEDNTTIVVGNAELDADPPPDTGEASVPGDETTSALVTTSILLGDPPVGCMWPREVALHEGLEAFILISVGPAA